MSRRLAMVLLLTCLGQGAPPRALTVLDADFDTDEAGFVYQDDTFRGTAQPAYASGVRVANGGFSGGALRVALGGIDSADVNGMSGGWRHVFILGAPEQLELTLRYRLTQSANYDGSEFSQAMAQLDGTPVGTGGADFVAEIEGDGNGGGERSTGYRLFRAPLGLLAAGSHTLVLGGYNNLKTSSDEFSDILIDDVRVATPEPSVPNTSAQAIVAGLELGRFTGNIVTLENFTTRQWSEQGNLNAGDWIEAELTSFGYAVERHAYVFNGEQRDNIYATKLGSTEPDRMYIVSGHMDSRNTPMSNSTFAPGADDDGSGTALVLEAARVFAPTTVQTETSIRFILWNNEETGLNGSAAYVADRRALRGVEQPPGSGQYPEPSWLGIFQHDMLLFDHGLPPEPDQIPGADVDIEYQAAASFVGEAIELATALHRSNQVHATDYPAEVSADMNFTDSKSFQADCAAISLRENRRVAEIGSGANPHWHQGTDQVATYSPEDFLLGFNALQTTVGALAELSGAVIVVCGDGILPATEECDDDNTEPGDGCAPNCTVEAGWTCTGEPSTCAVCRPENLRFPDAQDRARLVWDAPGGAVCAPLYDFARGDLTDLRDTSSLASATCLENDLSEPLATDATLPVPGEGTWYLVRIDGDSWQDLAGTGSPLRDSTLSACP